MDAQKIIKILPLGGIDEIGKNMTVIEYKNEIIIIDCGLGFPTNDLLGVNVLIPDFSYIIKNKHKIRGLVITHAHEDHIGALPYLLDYINPIIYCTEFTAGVIDTKLSEEQLSKSHKRIIRAGQIERLGNFNVEFIHTNHSIAGSVAVAIRTEIGTIIHTGDFKIEENSSLVRPIDMKRFKELGDAGVLVLMSDSTNATKEENTLNDNIVGHSLEKFVHASTQRIIIATFASNIYRMQQILDVAEKNNRKVAVSGRSMVNMLNVAKNLGYIKYRDTTLIDINDINKVPDNELLIITTGSQGEEMSALYRIANNIHKQIKITKNDKILLSSSPIPGNEKAILGMINLLMRRGAEVIYEKESEIHTSGHACQKELKQMLLACKPKFFIPVHGEFMHLKKHQEIAQNCGLKPENIQIPVNGYSILVTQKGTQLGTYIGCGAIYINDYGAGLIGQKEVETRKTIADHGCLVIDLLFNKGMAYKVLLKNIGFLAEGVLQEKEYQLKFMIDTFIQKCKDEGIKKPKDIEQIVKEGIENYLLNEGRYSPLVLVSVLQ